MDLVSIIVCTYNRSRSLAGTLESLAVLRTDGTFDVEVVVVDNNSRDDTKAVVESFASRFGPSTRPADSGARSGFRPADRSAGLHGRLRYVFEGRQGLSYARNRGIEEARGEIVAFTDDDVIPDANWLCRLHAAFQTFNADCVYGKVLPLWLGPRPGWLGTYFMDRLALLDRGDEPRLVTSPKDQFVGANVSVRTSVFATVGPFNVELGNRGDRVGGEEDTDFFDRLLARGARIAYTPEAIVYHNVPPERMTVEYFRRWHFQHGESSAHVTQPERWRGVLGIPFWAVRQCLGYLGEYLASLFAPDPERRLMYQMRLIYYAGFFSEKLRTAWRRGGCRSRS